MPLSEGTPLPSGVWPHQDVETLFEGSLSTTFQRIEKTCSRYTFGTRHGSALSPDGMKNPPKLGIVVQACRRQTPGGQGQRITNLESRLGNLVTQINPVSNLKSKNVMHWGIVHHKDPGSMPSNTPKKKKSIQFSGCAPSHCARVRRPHLLMPVYQQMLPALSSNPMLRSATPPTPAPTCIAQLHPIRDNNAAFLTAPPTSTLGPLSCNPQTQLRLGLQEKIGLLLQIL